MEEEGYSRNAMRFSLARHLRDEQKPQLTLDVPQWDGIDRLREICKVVVVEGFNSKQVHELLCHWAARIFQRLEDPTIQPITLVLKGKQGVGKDTLADTLTGGLGHYVKELNVGAANN